MKWIAAALAAFFVTTAQAQQNYAPILCGEIGKGTAALEREFGMVPTHRGIAGEGSLAVLMRAPDGGWAFIIIDPARGLECMFASGHSMEEAPALKKNSF